MTSGRLGKAPLGKFRLGYDFVAGDGSTITGNAPIPALAEWGEDGALLGDGDFIHGDAPIPALAEWGTGIITGFIEGDSEIPSLAEWGDDGNLLDNPIFGDAPIPSLAEWGTGSLVANILGDAPIPSLAEWGTGIVAVPIYGDAPIPSQAEWGEDGSLRKAVSATKGQALILRQGSGGSIINAATAKGTYRLYIRGADFTPYVMPGSINGDIELNFTARASITLSEHRNAPNALAVMSFSYGILNSGIDADDTVISLVDGSLLPASNFIFKLNTEYVWVYNRSGNTLFVNRGYNGSVPASHSSGTYGYQMHAMPDFVPPLPFFPQTGMPVEIWYYDGLANVPHRTNKWWKIFGGQLNSVTSQFKYHVTDPAREFGLSCTGYDYTLQRRVIKQTYSIFQYPTLNAVLAHINENYLIPEGLTLIPAPVDVPLNGDLIFDNIPLNEALDRLCEATGYDRATDFDRNVRIYDRPAAIDTAPHDITEDTTGPNGELWANLKVTESRGLYRNTQRIAGTYSLTSTTITKTYTVGLYQTTPFFAQWQNYPYTIGVFPFEILRAAYLTDFEYNGQITRIVEIRLNGQIQQWYTLGDPAPETFQWTSLSTNSVDLIFNTIGYPIEQWPEAGDTLTVTFEVATGTPPPTLVQNQTEIDNRKAIEGFGTGIYEAVEDFGNFDNADIVLQYAQALLARFGVMGLDITLDTLITGFMPGQQINVHLPSLNIPDLISCKVESISWTFEQNILLRYALKVSNAIQQRDSIAAFSRLIKRIRKAQKPVTDVAMWTVAPSGPNQINPGAAVGLSQGNPWPVRQKNITVQDIAFIAKTPPTGQDIRYRIMRNGVSLTQFPITAEANNGALQVFSGPWAGDGSSPTLVLGDILTLDILQVGILQPGANITIVVRGSV